jgi:hypothetical protein
MSLPGRGPFARPWVRIACAVLATAVLGLTVWAAGARAVLAGLGASVHALPALAGLEALMLACSILALRALYGESAALPSPRQWVQAGAAGYAVGLVVPMGRSAAEATRAILLGRSVGGPRAAVAAVQMQGVTLLSNALFVLPATVATLGLLGPGTTALFIFANGLVAGLLGTGILVVRQRGQPGRWLGAAIRRLQRFGMAFDATAGASRRDLLRALGWECVARCAQAVQCWVALAAIGQAAGPVRALVTRGLLMVGSALGDILPAQLGATEATLVVGASSLGLTPSSAASLALLVHGAQLLLGLVCTAIALALPGELQRSPRGAEASP